MMVDMGATQWHRETMEYAKREEKHFFYHRSVFTLSRRLLER